jgi:hypothetical protein
VQNRQNPDRGLISQKSRDLFAKFLNNTNNGLISNGKIRGPGPRLFGPARRAHRSLASGRSGAPKLANGGATERGERGELGSGLTGARAALRRPGDDGAERGGGSAW